MAFPIHLLYFIWKTIFYLSPVPFLWIVYKRYKHMSYVGLATTNFLLFLSSFFAYFVPYYYDTNLIAIWMASNICLYFSLWIAILSLILAQYDGIPWFSHLITLVFGVLIGLVLNPDNFSLSNENGIYQASYSWEIGILALFSI